MISIKSIFSGPKAPPSRDLARERREWKLESDRWQHQRHVDRGYRIKWGYVAIAYLVEFMVIGASLWGAWLFAGVYSDGDWHAFYFMLLAPLVYAAVELCRCRSASWPGPSARISCAGSRCSASSSRPG